MLTRFHLHTSDVDFAKLLYPLLLVRYKQKHCQIYLAYCNALTFTVLRKPFLGIIPVCVVDQSSHDDNTALIAGVAGGVGGALLIIIIIVIIVVCIRKRSYSIEQMLLYTMLLSAWLVTSYNLDTVYIGLEQESRAVARKLREAACYLYQTHFLKLTP